MLAPAPARATPPRPPLPRLAAEAAEPGTVVSDTWHIDCRSLGATSKCQATVATITSSGPRPPVTTEVELTLDHLDGYLIFSAGKSRHLLFHSGRDDGTLGLSIAARPPPERASAYTLEVNVLPDPDLEWQPAYPPNAMWHRDSAGWHMAVILDGKPLEPTPDLAVIVSFRDPGDLVHIGGPQLGLGACFRGDGSFRVRAEFEVDIDDWILPGISLDGDVARGWVLAPRVEIASPIILLIPSFSVGLGLPIRLEPDPDVGMRFLVGGQFGPVGVIASFDLYPQADSKLVVESSVLFRVSL